MGAGLLAVACATAGAAAWGARGWIEDSWWMWRLGSADRSSRIEAAETLAERKCIRAVSRIVHAIAEDPLEDIEVRTVRVVTRRCSRGSPLASMKVERTRAAPLAFALWRMGEPAFSELRRCVEDEALDVRTLGILARLLDRSKPMERELSR